MKPLRLRTLTIMGVVAAALTFAGTTVAINGGASPVRVPWTTLVVGILAGAAVLWMAWAVRQVKAGKRPPLDPTRSVRTAMFAQASAYAGVLVGGVYGAYALAIARDWGHQPRREVAIAAGLAAIGGLVMLVAGIVGERWCRIGPDDDEPEATKGVEPGVAH